MKRWRRVLALLALGAGIWLAGSGPANADGTPDPTFGGDGRVLIDVESGASESVSDVALDSEGRIIVAGTIFKPSTPTRGFVTRLLPSGLPDASFDSDGTYIFASETTLSGVEVDAGNRVIATGGDINAGTSFDFFAARLLESGTPDPSFSGDGLQTINFGGMRTDVSIDAVLDGQGRIVLTGYTALGGVASLAVARLKTDGELDPTYNASGFQFPDVGGASSYGNSVAIDDQGRILVAGSLTSGGVTNPLAIRLQPGGLFDSTFDGDGRLNLDFAVGQEETAEQVLIDEQKRIVLAGSARVTIGTPYAGIVARLSPSGVPDQSFSGDGQVVTRSVEADYVRGAALDPAGRIVTSGSLTPEDSLPSDALLMRFSSAGQFDTTLGQGGFLFEDFFAERADGGGFAIDAQGRYVLAGIASSSTEDRFGVTRYTVDYPKPPDPDPDPDPAPVFKCAGVKATITGTVGRNRLKGTAKRDVIAGLGGNDVIKSLKGNNLACGGNGNDKLVGGPGNDTLRGDGGKDTLVGGPGKDKLLGGEGKDRCQGGPGKNRLSTCEPARRRR